VTVRSVLNRLDPRDPLVFDTRELGRRAGSMRQVGRTVPAPADFGVVDVIGVPPGSDVELSIRLESVVEGVLVSGTARARIEGECVRCLDPVVSLIELPFQELYAYPETGRVEQDEEDTVSRLQGDFFDLEPVLRDAVVLALPLKPLCRDDCPGLCSECGARLADDPGHNHDAVDPRWAALGGLFDGASAPADAGTSVSSDEKES
jgi:uncharacterized protein